MNLDKFTTRAQEAVLRAQTLAASMDHQNIETTHLLKALLESENGTPTTLLQKAGVNTRLLEDKLVAELKKLPKVQGG
ncbi:MAG: hypothetical protein N2050_03175, partial [Flavobacteriales bacterium]|nr:hypothetical protein [Flavobacteriales bacterium]